MCPNTWIFRDERKYETFFVKCDVNLREVRSLLKRCAEALCWSVSPHPAVGLDIVIPRLLVLRLLLTNFLKESRVCLASWRVLLYIPKIYPKSAWNLVGCEL